MNRTSQSKAVRLKFALHPGTIISKNDGDLHFISYPKLLWLYQLQPHECVNGQSPNVVGYESDNYIHLYPRYLGDYLDYKATAILEFKKKETNQHG